MINKYIRQAMINKAYYEVTGKHLKLGREPKTNWIQGIKRSIQNES